MLRVLFLIFDPANTWERIAQAQHGVVRVFLLAVLPVLLVGSAVEAYGMIKFGRERGFMATPKPVAMEVMQRYQAVQLGLGLALLFGGGWLLKMIGQGFHRRHSYTECFATAAYSLTPLFLLRALNAIPAMNLWISWGIGIFLSVAVLYRGMPRLMKPDPSNALGLYFMASVVFILATGFANFLGILVLEEKILRNWGVV